MLKQLHRYLMYVVALLLLTPGTLFAKDLVLTGSVTQNGTVTQNGDSFTLSGAGFDDDTSPPEVYIYNGTISISIQTGTFSISSISYYMASAFLGYEAGIKIIPYKNEVKGTEVLHNTGRLSSSDLKTIDLSANSDFQNITRIEMVSISDGDILTWSKIVYNTDTTQPPALADGNGITLGGTGEPGATLTVKDGSGTTVCTATVAGDGSWSCTPASYPPAGSALNLTQQDAQGNPIGSATGADVRLRVPLELVLSPVQAPLNADLANQSVTFTLSNAASSPAVMLATPQITSARASEFAISANTCSATLTSGQSCTFQVDYTPDASSAGVRSALLNVPDAYGQTIASAILNSNEGASARRLPDVLTELSFQQNGQPVTSLQSGVDTTVSWGQTGYQGGMESIAALFECNQTTLDSGNCGNSYSANTRNSGFLSADTTVAGLWSNQGVQSKLNRYSWTFTPNCQGDQLVLRFYQRSLQDKAAGYPSLSLLAPGGLLGGSFYYDQEGRRLSVPCTSNF